MTREPEWQVKSTDLVHPFALIQKLPFNDGHVQQGTRHTPVEVSLVEDVYAWLNKTFKWRPVFDWDWFVTPNYNSLDNDLDYAFDQLREQWGFKVDSPASVRGVQYDRLVLQVAKQFRYMRQSGIPVHLRLGSRGPDTSSLYWGWPYDKTAWERWIESPFDASLRSVANHVDTLSVLYDLRNPLDDERLEEIEEQQPYDQPAARCPRVICPWKNKNNCPFVKQWPQTSSPTSQKMANKMRLKIAEPLVWLASNTLSVPIAGEYVNEYTSDDSDTEDFMSTRTLHQLARRAAYEREAVGWQRFWSEYAPRLTNLSELHVRMPRCFDKIGSMRLGRLINPNAGWKMAAFADEQQDTQTREDVVPHRGNDSSSYKREAEPKIWPAGRFVRRSWVRMAPPPDFTAKQGGRSSGNARSPRQGSVANTSGTGDLSEEDIEKREQEELDKAIARAREAALGEQELEETLQPVKKRPPPITVSDTESEPMDNAEASEASELRNPSDNNSKSAEGSTTHLQSEHVSDVHNEQNAITETGAASIRQDSHSTSEMYDKREIRVTPTQADVGVDQPAVEVESLEDIRILGALPAVEQRSEQDAKDMSVLGGIYVEETITIEQTFVEKTTLEQNSLEQTSVEKTSIEQTTIEQTSIEQTTIEETSFSEQTNINEQLAQLEEPPPDEQLLQMDQVEEEERAGGVEPLINEPAIDEPTPKEPLPGRLPTTPEAPSPIAESNMDKRSKSLTPESSQENIKTAKETGADKPKKKPPTKLKVNKSEPEVKPPTTKRGPAARKTKTKKTATPPSSDSEPSSRSSNADSDSDFGKAKTKRRRKPSLSTKAWEDDTSSKAKKQGTRGKVGGKTTGARATRGRGEQEKAAGDVADINADEARDGGAGVKAEKASGAKRKGTKRPAVAEPVSPVSKRTRLGMKKRGGV